jgi:hypothetical protein
LITLYYCISLDPSTDFVIATVGSSSLAALLHGRAREALEAFLINPATYHHHIYPLRNGLETKGWSDGSGSRGTHRPQ